jgi:carbamoyl-phosphate synthase small subunit
MDLATDSHPTAAAGVTEPAILILEDGRVFRGEAFGARGTALGEVVFNTSMTGYQEVLTDPSYSGQLVTMTYPLIGNYGANPTDQESAGPQVAGFVIHEAPPLHSNWRAQEPLEEYLVRTGVVAIKGVDTRALTRHIRSAGAMRGAIAPASADRDELLQRVHAHPRMEGLDLACGVSTERPYRVGPVGERRFRVLAYDLGVKTHSLKLLSQAGCRVSTLPATSPLSCRAVGRLLQTYLDGELDDPRSALVADHLDACLRCGIDASTYRWLKAQLAGLAPPDDDRRLESLRAFADQLVDGPA